MYESFFGLRERPFDLTANPRFLVLTEVHREALSSIEYGVSSGRGITVLIGEAGTGKTTIIRAALQRLPQRVHSVHLANPALTRAEFIEMLAIRFELSDEARSSKTALLIELEAALRARHEQGESSVLIIDEAQSVPLDLLEELRLLGNIETDDTKLLSIVLAGQPELAALLENESLRQLKQRVALRCELRPLTQAETAGYLAGRVRAAGGAGAQVFTREAVLTIHERSRGIPRTVSVIADNALLTAFALRHKPITSSIVTEVCRDLHLPAAQEDVPDAFPVEPPPAQPASAAPLPRLLTTESRQSVPAGDAVASTDADEDTPMFNTIYPKRRRFSLFSRSGS